MRLLTLPALPKESPNLEIESPALKTLWMLPAERVDKALVLLSRLILWSL